MSRQPVEAVLFARYNISNYKALYGRLGDQTGYTKDYIQIPASVSPKLKQLLNSTSDRVDVEYTWPGGSQHGHFTWSADRYHLKWDTDNPPKPWKLGAVGVDPLVSLPGDTTKRNVVDADAQLAAINASNITPWLLAIKLPEDGNRLHLRVYFETPPVGFEDRALALLPKKIQDEISALPTTSGTGVVYMGKNDSSPTQKVRAKKLVAKILAALEREPNVLLVGPPGTGKSVALEDLRNMYNEGASSSGPMFDPDTWSGEWTENGGSDARSESLVFHPSYSYENFVAGLFPKSSSTGISLEAKPGPLLCLSHWVGDKDRRALLILDEFNRGPAAAIFGDTLSLLDKDKRSHKGNSGSYISRPYPSEEMPVPETYRESSSVIEHISAEVRLPAGVHIVAAMNSTDRSVAPLDAAMRRRFTIIRVGPDYEALAEHLLADSTRATQQLPTSSDLANWQVDDVSVLAIRLLEAVNERIEYCLGEDFLIGHALVWSLDSTTPETRLSQLAQAIDTKVVPTLRMTFIDQDEVLAAVLGVPDSLQVSAGQSLPAATVAYWKLPPTALAAIAPKRLAVQQLHMMNSATQLLSLRSLADA